MQTVDFKHFPLEAGDKVLDLGCGEGRHAIAVYLAPAVEAVEVVGVDINIDDLRAAQQKCQPFLDAKNSQLGYF